MIKKTIKSQNNTNNKKSSVFKNIVSKFSAKNKSTPSNQKDLFNPELFLTIDEINKKFGKDTVCFGDQLGNLDYDQLLNSNDLNLLRSKADKYSGLKNQDKILRILLPIIKQHFSMPLNKHSWAFYSQC